MPMRATVMGIVGLVLAVGFGGCGGGGGGGGFDETGNPRATTPYANLGALEDDIEAAETSPDPADRADTDGDSIPDVVEGRLGTDRALSDTDLDGTDDAFELFGDDFDRSDPIPDDDRDGLIAPLDDDDDGNGSNDGLTVDTDGDGVANYLEVYGYSFDFLTGRFVPWDGDEDSPRFFTDPLQPSTDQDAYPDGMEVSGALLDPAVRAPGDDPLVPARPDLVVELQGYTVTLNEDVTVTDSETLSRGREWSRATETTHEHTDERTWQTGGELGFSLKSDSQGIEGKVSHSVGGTQGTTYSTATTVSAGESVTSESGWSVARSSNPTDAARLKLFLRVHNRGTAPVSDFVPTITLKIGGLNVATFEPAGAAIAMLVPGAAYPTGNGVHWVVDAYATGAPLSLTMSELRALELGAPVAITVTQVRGEVMRLAPGGTWESIGDTNEYTARCDAVCASVRIDLEDGTTVHHLVYAGDESPEPRTTLGEALRRLGVDEEGTLTWFDAAGTPHARSLDGYTFSVDPDTLRHNGWSLEIDGADETAAPEGAHLDELRLLPTSQVLVRAPRDPVETPGLTVHYAHFDAFTGEVEVSCADYRGVVSVAIVDDEGQVVLPLEERFAGSGFYGGTVQQTEAFDGSRDLRAVVTNLDDEVVERSLGRLYQPPEPVAPKISTVALDQETHRLYANVESGNPGEANSDVAWVRVFHDKLPDGVLELGSVVNFFEDPNGYEGDLGFELLHADPPLRVVAYVSPGVYTVREIDRDDPGVENVTVYRSTSSDLAANTVLLDAVLRKYAYTTARLDMDAVKDSDVVSTTTETRFGSNPPSEPGSATDLWVVVDGASKNAGAHVGFNLHYARVPGVEYRSLTKAEVEGHLAAGGVRDALAVGTTEGLRVGDVLAVLTSQGRYGKIKVKDIEWKYEAFKGKRSVTVSLSHVTWDN
jgi:hypothetical protein